MIIFMALAAGESALCTGPLTLHTESAIHIAELLTGAKFTIRNIFNIHTYYFRGVGWRVCDTSSR